MSNIVRKVLKNFYATRLLLCEYSSPKKKKKKSQPNAVKKII